MSGPLPGRASAWVIGVVLAAFLVAWLFGLGARSLFHPDEGRYAEIPREMLASGDWLTPRLNGLKYFEKPPFQYWATAASYRLFGEHAWSARLWTGLSGVFTVAITVLIGMHFFGRAAGATAGMVLGTNFLFFYGGQINTLDMGLTFWLTLAMGAFLVTQDAPAGHRRAVRASYLMWAALAAAVLSKGVVALVLPAFALGLYTISQRDLGWRHGLRMGRGLLLFFLIAAPWFIAVSLVNPEFPAFFVVHEHLDRFLSTAHGRSQPWWFFMGVLALGLLPWAGLAPGAIGSAWRATGGRQSGFQVERFLVLWVVAIVVFFSASRSKLPFYILPALPALALLMGRHLARLDNAGIVRALSPAAISTLVLILVAVHIDVLPVAAERLDRVADWADSMLLAGGLFIAGFVAAHVNLIRGRRILAMACVAAAAFAGYLAILVDAEEMAPDYSAVALSTEINRRLTPTTVVFGLDGYDQTLPFYIKRSVSLVAFRGELDFGLRQEPQAWIPDRAGFAVAWRETPDALAVMSPAAFKALEAEGLPMRLVFAQGPRWLVTKPAREVPPIEQDSSAPPGAGQRVALGAAP